MEGVRVRDQTAAFFLPFSLLSGPARDTFILHILHQVLNLCGFDRREMASVANEDERLRLEDGLLQNGNDKFYTGDGSVDLHGKPVLKSNTGKHALTSSTECCERLAYYGIATNLVSYLTKKLHEGNVSDAGNVTTLQGNCYLTPLVGAILADTSWGRCWTIAVISTIYFIGMCTLTLSASIPALKPAECVGSLCPTATPAQYAVFFFGLYLIALGTGGIKALRLITRGRSIRQYGS